MTIPPATMTGTETVVSTWGSRANSRGCMGNINIAKSTALTNGFDALEDDCVGTIRFQRRVLCEATAFGNAVEVFV